MPSTPTSSIWVRITGSAARKCLRAAAVSTPRSGRAGVRLRLAGNDPGDAGVGRVLGLDLAVGPDLVDRLGNRDRRLREPGRDQLELAIEGGDVATRPDAFQGGLHQPVHDDRALLDL